MSNILLPKPALGTPIAKGELLSKGLVANFPFSDGRGDVLSDFSLEKNHGTITGATWGGSRLLWTGTNTERVTIPTVANSSLDLTGQGTLIVKYTPAAVDGTGRSIIGRHNYQMWVWMASGRYNLRISTATNVLVSNVVYTTNSNVMACTFDDVAGVAKFYHNGIFDNEATGIATDMASSSNDWYIGEDPRDGTGLPYDGSIEYAFIYNRVLSASEIAALYINPNLPMQQPPIWLLQPPVVTGLTIPIAMHHYKQMQGVA